MLENCAQCYSTTPSCCRAAALQVPRLPRLEAVQTQGDECGVDDLPDPVGPRLVGRQEAEDGEEAEAQPEEFGDGFDHGRGGRQ